LPATLADLPVWVVVYGFFYDIVKHKIIVRSGYMLYLQKLACDAVANFNEDNTMTFHPLEK